jgi:hypothetical protein
VGPERLVLNALSFDEHLRLPEGGEDLSIRDFESELPDDLLNAVSLAVHPDLPLRARYCHRPTQNLCKSGDIHLFSALSVPKHLICAFRMTQHRLFERRFWWPSRWSLAQFLAVCFSTVVHNPHDLTVAIDRTPSWVTWCADSRKPSCESAEY